MMFERIWTYARTFNPRWVITVLVVAVLAVNFANGGWSEGKVISPEVVYYYDMLPAAFQKGIQSAVPASLPTIGTAISYLPFYALAELAARLAGFPADGYSAPYQFAVQLSSLVYFVIGLIFLGKLLRLHFAGHVASIALVIVVFGTNAFYYLTGGAGMPHALSFMLTVLYLYQVIAWHQLRNMSSAVQLGLLLGAVLLVRPLNGLLLIVFVFYDVRRWKELVARFKLFARKSPQLLVILITATAVMVPQFLFWKHSGGAFLPGEVLDAEGYHFKRPHVLQGLFSFHKGWLVHAPLMAMSIAGFFFMRGMMRMYAWSVPVFFLVYIYVVFSWWCWWHGPSFGQRALIDIYGVLAVPLGAFVYKLRRLGGLYKHVMYFCIIVLVALNMWRSVMWVDRRLHDACDPVVAGLPR